MLVVALLRPLARTDRRRWIVAATVALAVTLAGVSQTASAATTTAAAAAAAPARAAATDGALDASLIETVRSMALDHSSEAERKAAGQRTAPRVEVSVGQLDPRLRLAPCQRIEPYLPPSVRLWGRSRIGLRCKEGPVAWNVYLPITVKVYGRALVLPQGGVAGSIVSESDLAVAEVDLAEEQTVPIADASLATGRLLAQNLRPGSTLRAGHLKLRQFFAAGETVKIVVSGPGFSLESEGQALVAGIEGTPSRVRIENGRIVTGLPSGERRIELAP